jgi:hypothetical protein
MSGSLIYAAEETEVSLAMHIFVRAVLRAQALRNRAGTLQPRNKFACLDHLGAGAQGQEALQPTT